MTLQEGIEISQKAKALRDWATRAKQGKVQFFTVVYSPKGISTETPTSEYLTYSEAMAFLDQLA